MRHSDVGTHSRAGIAAIIATVAMFAGATSAGAQTPKLPSPIVVTTIRAMFDSSAAAWNRGDVRGHHRVGIPA